MKQDAAKAIASLAAAIEAFSTISPKTSARLASELRLFLGEKDSLAAPNDSPAPSAAASEDLTLEVLRLRDELRRAKEAARGRDRRAAKKSLGRAAPDVRDPRQVPMFESSVQSVQVDGRLDVRTPSLSDPDLHKYRDQRSGDAGRPDFEPVANDPDAPPREALDVAERERPDLPEAVVRHSWRGFAKRNRSHECFAAMLAHWSNWIRNEDRVKAEKRMYTAYQPPAPPPEPDDGEDLPDVPPAPPSAVQRLAETLELPRVEADRFATPADALEALMRIDRDPPEPRAMSA